MEQPALLEMRNITKEFPGVKALDGVSLTVRPEPHQRSQYTDRLGHIMSI